MKKQILTLAIIAALAVTGRAQKLVFNTK